jgi:hypothetical protein
LTLQTLATRALDAKVNGTDRTAAEIARAEFIEQLARETGLSDRLLFLLRKEEILP